MTISPNEKHERLKATLSKLSLFNDLTPETQAAFLAAAAWQHFEAGQVIYIEGEPANYVYILEHGWVKSTRMTHEGREQGLLFLQPVEIFGDIAVFTDKPYPGTVTALEKVDAWVLPAERMLTLVKEHPDLALAVIQRLSERVLHSLVWWRTFRCAAWKRAWHTRCCVTPHCRTANWWCRGANGRP